MDNYKIEIPNEKAATYKVVTFIIALINVLVFAFLFFNADSKWKALAGIGFGLSAMSLLLYFLAKKNKGLSSFRIEIAFIIDAIIWAIMAKYLLAFFMIVFAVLGIFTNKKLIINFSAKGILYPSFPPKLFSWKEV